MGVSNCILSYLGMDFDNLESALKIHTTSYFRNWIMVLLEFKQKTATKTLVKPHGLMLTEQQN